MSDRRRTRLSTKVVRLFECGWRSPPRPAVDTSSGQAEETTSAAPNGRTPAEISATMAAYVSGANRARADAASGGLTSEGRSQ